MASESKSSTVVSAAGTQDSEGTNTHDPACRIVVVSPSLDVGVAFVERVKGFSSESSSPKASATIKTPTQETSQSLITRTTAQEHEQPLLIPHVLSNKYYTAPVHFAVCLAGTTGVLGKADPSSSSAGDARPPAIVFVWSRSLVDGSGKKYDYKEHAEKLARQIQATAGWEPEVVLGVRLPSLEDDKANEDEGDDEDENAEIDNALMQLGFEYVDVSDDVGVGSTEKKGEDNDDELEIPGLPRVLDALSTIMWPSMTSQEKGKGKILTFEDKARQEAERDGIMHELLLSVSDMSEFGRTAQEGVKASTEDAFFSPYDFGRRSTGVLPKPTRTESGKSSKPWLDTSSGSHLASPRDGSMLDSPGEMAGGLSPFGVGEGDGRLGKKVSMRFEDDFAEFISAPVVVADQDEAKVKTTGSNTSTNATGKRRGLGMEHVDLDLDLSQAGFEEGEMETPLQTAIAESVVTGDSLGLGFGLASGKSLGEEQGQRLGVPSKSRYASLGSVSDFGDADGDGGAYEELGEEEEEEWEDAVEEVDHSGWEDEEDIEDDDDLGLLPSKEEIEETAERIFGRGGSSSNMEGFRRASEEDRDFDLEDVLHSLRDLKSEIAGMDNEEEKHKLAAKVALGLVYGIK